MEKQHTLAAEIKIAGVGLHTGQLVHMILKPAPVNYGIAFVRVDLPNRPVIKVCPENVTVGEELTRCTGIKCKDAAVYTIEHLMSVLAGLKIDNLLVEIDASETPILDGSGIEFLKAIEDQGVAEQDAERKYFKIIEPIGMDGKNCSIFALPADEFKISYTLVYEHPLLGTQFFEMNLDKDDYKTQLAGARTFCMEREVSFLREQGLAKGASTQNALVFANDRVLDNQLRFPNEPARHKVLDLVGDLYMLGKPIKGHFVCLKSGHELNYKLVKKIAAQEQKFYDKAVVPMFSAEGKREFKIEDIMKIIPHRYPFLLVDKVVEVERGKKVIGLKNVTMNEQFFTGHFPARPVMPGVLMLEAMAQTAGICVLSLEENLGKVPLFITIDQVKFRKMVVPGDQLVMEIEVVKARGRLAQILAVGKVADAVVVEAEMKFALENV
ncbi:MAG: bifunctional UDP-3-O-[3-hydroxymyristoyl] N-acetylglucosamine deacetylase/3-hydroxyacyl-ACP dehydratase [Candidatus Omnitrophica bacterium]|nr:bifunctional UDP-3-O-[3-hydroxymyristoyl] N-acetylglucosamine deacetylase/3-hydroxyacyl-ACP dehydratase [Candidatus Omnitrophota bacterium]